ncbi:hypothetical protein V8C42DRAFT_143310 [Trichoderma barbatum]
MGRILCAFYWTDFGTRVLGFHFVPFHYSSFLYFPFAYSTSALSAGWPAKSVGEIIEDGLGRQGESWSDFPTLPLGRWRRLRGGLCFIFSLGLDLTMLEYNQLPVDLHPFLELALCGHDLLLFLNLATFQSTSIAALCVKRRKLSNRLTYSFSHQCYESDRMYEQWGFTPPPLPLPHTRGSFDSQLACHLLPVLRLLFPLRDKNLFFFLPHGGGGVSAAICGHVHSSRTLIPLTTYPCGLARIMRGGACMHGSRKT